MKVKNAEILSDKVDRWGERQLLIRKWGEEYTVKVRRYVWIGNPDRKYRSEVVMIGHSDSYARVDNLPETPEEHEIVRAIESLFRGPPLRGRVTCALG